MSNACLKNYSHYCHSHYYYYYCSHHHIQLSLSLIAIARQGHYDSHFVKELLKKETYRQGKEDT